MYTRPNFYNYWTLYQTKWLENHTLSSGTYPYSQYMRETPPPGGTKSWHILANKIVFNLRVVLPPTCMELFCFITGLCCETCVSCELVQAGRSKSMRVDRAGHRKMVATFGTDNICGRGGNCRGSLSGLFFECRLKKQAHQIIRQTLHQYNSYSS